MSNIRYDVEIPFLSNIICCAEYVSDISAYEKIDRLK